MKEKVICNYNAKKDSKDRITLKHPKYKYYSIKEYSNGKIILYPKAKEEISENTLKIISSSINNFKKGNISKPINLD